jgi:hypothetical protein
MIALLGNYYHLLYSPLKARVSDNYKKFTGIKRCSFPIPPCPTGGEFWSNHVISGSSKLLAPTAFSPWK